MLKIIIALVVVAHGIGHIMGPMQVLKVATINPQWNGESWLLSGGIGTTPAQVIGIVLWVAALIGFAALGGVVMGWLPASWWQPLAIGASVASIAGILLFPMAFPPFSTIGAMVVNVAVLVAVLWYDWTPADLAA